MSPSFRALTWAYGCAHGGKTLFWTASDLYFTFYMTEVCGVAPLYTGIIIGCSLLFAALADLGLIGLLTRRGIGIEPARMQACGSVASAAALLLFASVAYVPPDMRLGASIVTLFTFRAAYALLDVPQNALLALATSTDEQRRRMTAVRNAAGAVARTALAFAFVPVMAHQGPIDAGRAFLGMVALLSVFTIVGALILSRLVAGHTRSIVQTIPDGIRPHGGRTLMAMMTVMTIATTIFSQIEPYLASYGMGRHLSASAFMGLIAVGAALSQTAWLSCSISRSPSALLGYALAMMVGGSCLLVFVPRDVLIASGGAALLYGIGLGGVLFVLWSGIARSASHGDAVGVIGRFTAVAKMGQGVAVVIAGALLDGWLSRTDGGALAAVMAGAIATGAMILLGLSIIQRGQAHHMLT
ncbi:MFS transporter [Sphingomonas sp. CFBP 8760]|uniref:MFS transporter n=1 Tax=Sphingomonas sp. CFBP 8760 TaxID=2775282 RepID=UPI0017819A83|nr:MFS transporter [Sphingomonas sp. CFBP 8760]